MSTLVAIAWELQLAKEGSQGLSHKWMEAGRVKAHFRHEVPYHTSVTNKCLALA